MNPAGRQMANAYEKARACAPQPWMVAALLAGAIRHLEDAEGDFLNNRRAKSINRVSKTIAILQGLRDNLRSEVSAGLCERLDTFYRINIYRISTLVRSGFNTEENERIKADLRKMYDAWASVGTEGTEKA